MFQKNYKYNKIEFNRNNIVMDDINIDELSKYMLKSLSNNLNTNKNFNKIDSKLNNNKSNNNFDNAIKKPNIYVDYNKFKSKYNERYKPKYDDKLFWCFYKLMNNLEDSDVENINHFNIEKETKMDREIV